MNSHRFSALVGGLTVALVSLSTVLGQSPIAPPQTHRFIASSYYNTFSRMHPVLGRVRPGDTVATETLDSSGRDKDGQSRGQSGNPLTGPFYVEGAAPGDTLVVRFTRVRLNRKWG